jgi:hypothetical protein
MLLRADKFGDWATIARDRSSRIEPFHQDSRRVCKISSACFVGKAVHARMVKWVDTRDLNNLSPLAETPGVESVKFGERPGRRPSQRRAKPLDLRGKV